MMYFKWGTSFIGVQRIHETTQATQNRLGAKSGQQVNRTGRKERQKQSVRVGAWEIKIFRDYANLFLETDG